MPSSTQKGIWGFPVTLCLLLLGSFFLPSGLFAQVDHFLISGPGANLYQVNQNFYTFTVTALNAGNTTVAGYQDGVTVGLYNTVNPPLKVSDPGVTIVSNSVTTTGPASVTFVNGVLTFQMKFESGSDSEQVYIQDSGGSPVTTGDTYPGIFAGVIGGAAITVQGFPSSYYLEDANLDSTAASYPVSTDLLIAPTDTATINFLDGQGGPFGTNVPVAGGVTGISGIDTAASSYAITNVTGGYAAGGANILSNLYFQKTSNATNTPVTFEVILDYGAGGVTLSDYNNPRTNVDTVYLFAKPDIPSSGFNLWNTPGAPVSNASFVSAPLNPFMTNGQIIVRIWAGSATNPVQVQYEDYQNNATYLSSVIVPYSTKNVSPVKATVAPATVLSNSNPVTLTYTITNQYSSALTQITYQIPPNFVGGADWSFNTPVTSPVFGHPSSSAVVTSNPSGTSAPGTITVNFTAGSPMAVNEAVTLQMIGIATSESNSWPISLLTALSTSGNAPIDPSVPIVKTLGVPGAPGGLTAVPINFTTGGGAVSLSWTQPVTNENPTSYILTGAAGGTVTIAGIGTTTYTDNTAVNLTGYTYSLRSYNGVAQSPPANVGPVTAYANPNPPGPVTALSGGTSIQLNWPTPVAAAGAYPVSGYQVFMGPSGGETLLATVLGVGTTTYINSPLATSGVTYFYQVAAFDTQYPPGVGAPGTAHISGLTAENTQASGEPPGNPPTAAISLIYPGGSTPSTIMVSWIPPAPVNVLNGPITGYQIFKAQSSPVTSAYAPLTTVGAVTFFNDYNAPSTFSSGTAWKYYVVAIDNKGINSNQSNFVTQGVGPSAPTGFAVASVGTTSISFTWNPNPGVEGVVNYILNRDVVGPVTSINGTSVTDTTMSYGVNHTYYLTAADSGPVTGPHSVTLTMALVPNAPTNEAVSYIYGSNSISVTWFDPDTNLAQYLLFRKIDSGAYAGITHPPAGSVSYFDAAPASAGSTVSYIMLAENIAGDSVTYSTAAGLQIPPNAPTGLTTSSSAAAITLNWTANPGSENVTIYSVYRSTNPVSGFVSIGKATSPTITFNDGSALAGTNYYYQITATNPGGGGFPGGESLASASVTASLLLGPPASLTTTVLANNTSVALTWTAPANSSNLTGYNVYQGTTNNFASSVNLASLAATILSYTDSSPTTANAGVTYFYWVQGLNTAGAGATILKGVQLPPNAPVSLGAAPSAASIPVTWVANPGSEAVSFYTLYRGTSPNPVAALATSILGTNYTDITALTGTTYYYRLTATNTGSGSPATILGGISNYSSGIITGRLPQAPANMGVSLMNTNNDIAVTWTDVTGVDSNATSLTLYSNTSAVTAGAAVSQIIPANTTGVTQLAQNPDSTFYYWLQTNNAFGTGALTGPFSTLTYPAAVSLVSAVLDVDGVSRDLTWTPVGGADVTQYNIYREQLGASSFVSMGFAPAAGLTFPVKRTSPVLPGKSYIYKITAVNAAGEGASQNAVMVGIPPSKPTGVTALSGVSNAGVTVNLSWSDPNAASEGVTAYTVYQATTLTGTYSSIASGITITNYSDGSVTGTGVYYYVIAADDGTGQESPVTYTSAVAVTAFALPNPPGSFSGTAVPGAVNFTWSSAVATTYPVASYNITRVNLSSGVSTISNTVATSYTDSGLTNGVTYVYYLQAKDNLGNLSPASGPVTATPIQPPGPPTSVSVATGDQELQITWNAGVPGTYPIASYQVYRSVPGPLTLLATVGPTVTGYLATGLIDGNSYSYYLVSVDSNAVTTSLDISVNSTTVPGSPVALVVNPPSALSAAAGTAQVVLSWTDSVTVLGGAAVTGYTFFQSTSQLSGYVSVGFSGPVASPKTFSGLTNGSNYYYYMVASSTTGVSANSATVFGTPSLPPPAPTPLNVTDGNGQAALNWGASIPTAPVTIVNYKVVQRVLPAGVPVIFTTSGPVTTYAASGLTNGQTVVYQVAGVGSNNIPSALSSAVSAFPYAPFAPTGLNSTDGANGVTFNFTAPGTPWGVALYDLVRTPLGGGAPITIVSASNAVTDTSGTLGQLYVYTVAAIDAKGHTSAPSSPVTDSSGTPPAPPATFIVTAGDRQNLIDWQPSAPVTGAPPVAYYILTGVLGGPKTLPATTTWYLDTGLGTSTSANYSIQAVDATGVTIGNHASILVGPVNGTTNTNNLNPPTSLAVTATGTSTINLSWALPNDMGKIVGSFYVFRSSTFTGGYTKIATLTNSALAPVTTYSDISVSPNTTYYYLVQAYYLEPFPPTASPNSNHAWTTTPAPVVPPTPPVSKTMVFDANVLLPMTGQKLTITYVPPSTGDVEIHIYNISGNVIRYLYPGTATADTPNVTTWDGTDRNGQVVASGVYFVEIKAPGFHLVKKVAVVK